MVMAMGRDRNRDRDRDRERDTGPKVEHGAFAAMHKAAAKSHYVTYNVTGDDGPATSYQLRVFSSGPP